MSCTEWIDTFLKKFVRRLDPPEWPDLGSDEEADFRDDWAYALDQHRVTEAEATEAIMRLRQDPPQWKREHLPKFLAAIEAIRKDRRTADDATDRDRAVAASDACPYCSGSGQLEVFDPAFDGRRVVRRECEVKGAIKVVPYAMVVPAHCSCALGRWMRSQVKDRPMLDRIVDVADVLAGRSRFQLEDPTFDGTPAIAPFFARSTDQGGIIPIRAEESRPAEEPMPAEEESIP